MILRGCSGHRFFGWGHVAPDAALMAKARERSLPPGAATGILAAVESFSVRAPEGAGWELTVDEKAERVTIFRRAETGLQIRVLRNEIADGSDRIGLTADAVADDFREHERQVMLQRVVQPGLYELENVVQETVYVGERKFYSMRFRQVWDEKKTGSPTNSDGVMYLYFPSSFPSPAEFYVLTFGEAHDRFGERPVLSQAQIDSVLLSFQPKRP